MTSISMRDVYQQITLTVTHQREMRVRLWLGLRLMRLAAAIICCKVYIGADFSGK